MRISDWSSDVCSSDLRHDILRREFLEQFGREDVLGHSRARDRRDRVAADVVFRTLEVERLGQSREPQLRGAIVGLTEIAVEPSRRGGHQAAAIGLLAHQVPARSEEHPYELQSLMRTPYAT